MLKHFQEELKQSASFIEEGNFSAAQMTSRMNYELSICYEGDFAAAFVKKVVEDMEARVLKTLSKEMYSDAPLAVE